MKWVPPDGDFASDPPTVQEEVALLLLELGAILIAFSLLNRSDQSLFLISLSNCRFILILHRDLEPDQVAVLHFLIVCSDVVALASARFDGSSHMICHL